MDRIITDPKTRQYIYGILCAAVPVLVATGVIAEDQGGLWITLIGAVLAPAGLGLAAANTPPRVTPADPWDAPDSSMEHPPQD